HAVARHARLRRNVGKLAVTEVAVKRVTGRWLSVRHVSSVGEEQVQPAIVVVIDPGHAGADGLVQVPFGRGGILVAKGNSRLDGDVDKLNRQLSSIGDSE